MDAVYRVIEHTADVAIEAEAPDLAGLLDRCAAGMFSLLVEAEIDEAGAGHPERPIELRPTGFDLPELLVAWLRELLWLHHERGWFYRGARFETLADTELVVQVDGCLPSPDEARIVRELKAVTYHDLVVERRADGWYARVVFDV